MSMCPRIKILPAAGKHGHTQNSVLPPQSQLENCIKSNRTLCYVKKIHPPSVKCCNFTFIETTEQNNVNNSQQILCQHAGACRITCVNLTWENGLFLVWWFLGFFFLLLCLTFNKRLPVSHESTWDVFFVLFSLLFSPSVQKYSSGQDKCEIPALQTVFIISRQLHEQSGVTLEVGKENDLQHKIKNELNKIKSQVRKLRFVFSCQSKHNYFGIITLVFHMPWLPVH